MTVWRTRQAVRRGLLVAFALLTASCAHRFDPRARPTCLVLSVGGPAAVAHLGALRAVRESRLPVSCVVGNSMGALIGGLYAAAPTDDTEQRFRAVVDEYRQETERASRRNGLALGLLLGALATVVTDGAAAPFVAAGTGYLMGALGSAALDRDRLVSVLDRTVAGVRIQDLPVRFATFHHLATEGGVTLVAVREGNLADAVGRSVANPLLFPELVIAPGAAIDPGADRVAAIPVDDACRLFPDHNLLVLNASGADVFTGPDLRCPVREARIRVPSLTATEALAFGPAYQSAVDAGYRATLAALR